MYAQKTILMHYDEQEVTDFYNAKVNFMNTYDMLKENDCECIQNPTTGEIKTVDDIVNALDCIKFLIENPLYELI